MAETTYGTLTGLLKAAKDAVAERNRSEWLAAGGCTECNGWGTILTWMTLDGSAYDEFGSCPADNCTAFTLGKLPGSVAPGTGRYRGVAPLVYTPEEEALIAEIEAEIASLETLHREIEAEKTVRKGCDVVVVRGRKVPRGTEGRVFWVGDSPYGVRVGINTPSGETVWTAAGNVEVAL